MLQEIFFLPDMKLLMDVHDKHADVLKEVDIIRWMRLCIHKSTTNTNI